MLKRIDYKHQPKPITLTKGHSTYKKLEKEMNKPPSLVENNENNIEKISNNIQSKNVNLMPHKKKHISIKTYLN